MIYFLEFDGISFFVGNGAMDSCNDWRNIAIETSNRFLHPGLFFFVERILVLTLGAPQSATGIRIAVAGPHLSGSCSGPDTIRCEAAQALRTGCITGRESAALLRRAQEMKMEFIYMKQPLKMPAYEKILDQAGVSDSAVACIGDDLPDIPLMRRVGLAVAVGDAVPEVKEAAHYTTKPSPNTAQSAKPLNSSEIQRRSGSR